MVETSMCVRLTRKKKLTLNYSFKTFKLGYESSPEYFFDLKKYTSTSTQVPPFTIPKAGFTNKQIAGKYANCVQTKKCSLALKLQPYNTTRRNIHRRGKRWEQNIFWLLAKRAIYWANERREHIFEWTVGESRFGIICISDSFPFLTFPPPLPTSFTLSACWESEE